MKRPSPRCFPNTVVLRTVSRGRDAAGGQALTPSAGTTFRASVQPAGDSRRAVFGGLYAGATHAVAFRDFPLDTSVGARAPSATGRLGPEVNANDTITWAPPSGPARTLVALGPALDQAGRGAMWVVPCSEAV